MTEHDEHRELTPDEIEADPATARENFEPNEMTTFDGDGTATTHVFANDEDGHLAEGVGENPEKALKDAQDTGTSRGV